MSNLVNVDWKLWSEERPETTGVYLTYWSDKALETFVIGIDELDMELVSCSSTVLIYWAENVAPPSNIQ